MKPCSWDTGQLLQLMLLLLLLMATSASAALTFSGCTPTCEDSPTVTTTIDENSVTDTAVVTLGTAGATGSVTYSIESAVSSASTDASSAFKISGAAISVDSPTLLDRESISYVDIGVMAVDNATSEAVNKTIRVSIKDVNEEDPQISPSTGYSVTVSESATAPTSVQVINVTDPDSAATPVTCSIISGNALDLFEMNADGKTVQLKSAIEPDSPTNNPLSYTLTVNCSDNTAGNYSGGQRSSTATVSVSVNIVNDHNPVWGNFTPAYTNATTAITTIDEKSGSGTALFTANATDADAGADGDVVYELVSAQFDTGTDASGIIGVDASSGAVTVNGTTPVIDRESYSHIDIVVKAKDSSATTVRSTTITVRVGIKDVNEFDPVFTPANGSFTATFVETEGTGYDVKTLVVVDPDAAATAVQCSIVEGNTLDRFQVHSDGKTVKLKTAIEPDSPIYDPITYVLKLDCVDNNDGTYSGGNKTSTATLSVSVQYNNDYAPEWNATSFDPPWTSATTVITTIPENKAVNETVFTAAASDKDAGVDGVIVYTLTSATAESGADVTSAFKINSDNGTVSIANSTILDRESYGYVDVTLGARDSPAAGTPNTTSIVVRVGLSDYNEFRPVFTPASGSYAAFLTDEVAADTAVQTIVVDDPDYLNTTVVCAIVGGNSRGKFRMSATDKKKVETDAEIQPDRPASDPYMYLLSVQCVDMNNGTVGTPIRTSTAYVTVNVTLVNDNSPNVTLNGTSITIPEDLPDGTVVATVTSDDLDVGIDGEYTLSLNPATPFTLTGDYSRIFLSQPLDRETNASYTIEVIAIDKGSPARSTTATLFVTVSDANDNTPVCTPSVYYVSVTENTTKTLLPNISCTDADFGDNKLLAYSLITGSTPPFTLSATTGELQTAALDYDVAAPNITLVVGVRDSATPASAQRTATVTVSVFVEPLNDGSPTWGTFNPPWVNATTPITSISEVAEAGYHVFTAPATDTDTGPDGVLEYSIVSATASDGSTDLSSVFNISSTGLVAVKTTGLMDREAASAYTYVDIVVQARDSPTTGTRNTIQRTVRVTINDANELDPKFTSEPYTATLAEDSTAGTEVKVLEVTDPDNSNTPIVCEITDGNSLNLFRPKASDPKVIELNQAIDPDKPNNHPLSYSLNISCKDYNGTHGFRSATTILNVTVTTLNDHQPEVSIPIGSTFSLPETQALGDVADINAFDNDYGTDGNIACSIAPTGTFALTGCTKLRLVSELDYPTASSHSLTIKAVDSGATPRTGSVVVTVNVVDVNRHSPSCSPTSFTASVAEDSTAPSALNPAVTVSCSDADGNGVYYQMVTADEPFSVGNTTGVVQLTGPVDYDSAKQSYSLQVKAVDPADSTKTAVVTVTVNITAVNEHTPTFTPTSVGIQVKETLASNAIVTTFAATDADYSPHAITGYSIVSGNTGSMFSINNAGVVSIAASKTLDYETVSGDSPYTLEIKATDGGGLSSTGTLTITVMDANDNAPVFTGTPYSANVDEGTAANVTVLTVAATDSDSATNDYNKILFRKGSGDGSNYFSVDSGTGVVKTTANSLNYDTVTSVTFNVLAIDGGGAGPHTTTAAVSITVVNLNRFAPSCTSYQNTVTNIREDVATSTQIFSYTSPSTICTDGDTKDSLSYTMSSTAGDAKFAVASASGAVTVSSALDFETSTVHTFEIIVADDHSSPKSVTVTITVSVLDVNEAAPTCTVPSTATIDENQPVGTEIFSITNCSDADASSTAFTYNISAGSFVVSSSGKVTTGAVLDYDPAAATTSYSVVTTVTDNAPSIDSLRSTDYTTVVTVNPVNEFPPVLTYSILKAEVAENASTSTALTLKTLGGTTVTMAATDADRGSDHATITWEIVSGNADGKFSIDSASGVLSTNGALDRETVASYQIGVRAKDAPGLVSAVNCTVDITVTDINDNSPICNPVTETITLAEGESAKQIVDFNALNRVTDADAGSNAALSFSLRNSASLSGEFELTGSRLKTKRSFTTSDPSSYSLEVVASDSGTGPLVATCTVVVNIVTTARPPTFTVADRTEVVAEDTAASTQVFQFSGNLGTGGTAPLTMSLLSFTPSEHASLFAFEASTGKVSVNGFLDYDNVATRGPFVLRVKLTDATPLTATGTLTISLSDVNDNNPAFASSVEFNKTINENVGVNFLVQKIDWTDHDSGLNGVANCSITSQSSPAIFYINASECELRTLANPNREVSSQHNVTITLTDMGSPLQLAADQLFRITIADVNDNTPAFGASSFPVSVAEEAVAPQTVGTFAASDADTGVNSQLTYSLQALDAATDVAKFTVSSTGQVTTTTTLDREATGTHRLLLLAQDAGVPPRTGSTTIVVTVTDINDHTPTLSGGAYVARVAENATAGTVVYTISATDADSTFGVVTYSIVSGNTGSGFAINSNTGQVSVASPVTLDREAVPVYSLVVKAQDNGSPPKSATTTLTVTVADANEHAPAFASPTVSFSISENSPVNSNVGTVSATDPDVSQNLRYAIHDTLVGTAGHFDINPVTGVIFVKQAALDRETLASYLFRVKAFDDGSPSLTSSPMLNVTVNVADTNDNDPVFGSASYAVVVNENATVGSLLLTVAATDADAGSNAALTFSIDPAFTTAASLFSIGGASGQLRVAASLDYETAASHVFVVVVKDAGTSPQRSATATVNVTLVNVNEHAPVFTPTFYNCEVPYDDNSQKVLATLNATDADAGSFGSVTFSWNETNAFLHLRSDSGKVIRNSDTTMETSRTYVQFAVARDAPGLESAPATVRCDSFPPEDHVVLIHSGLSDSSFDAQLVGLIASLNSTLQTAHPGASVKFWKKQWSGTRWVGYFYSLKNTDTDSPDNLAQPKEFLTKQQLLDLWRADAAGSPAAVLKTSAFVDFSVQLVEPYPDKTDDTQLPFYEQWWGQLALAAAGVVLLCLVGAGIFGLVSALSGGSAGGAAVGGVSSVAPAASAGQSAYSRAPIQQRHILPQRSVGQKPPGRFQSTPRPNFDRGNQGNNGKAQQQPQKQKPQQQQRSQSKGSNQDSGRGSANSDLLEFSF